MCMVVQVLAQAVAAANATVSDGKNPSFPS